jgi:hypothetical protein
VFVKGFVSAEREAAFNGLSRFWGVTRNAPKGGNLHPLEESTNCIIAKVIASTASCLACILKA